jgi:transcription initiation factor TFIIIB Brf1 subunit/transcription initiation factor TFIIB
MSYVSTLEHGKQEGGVIDVLILPEDGTMVAAEDEDSESIQEFCEDSACRLMSWKISRFAEILGYNQDLADLAEDLGKKAMTKQLATEKKIEDLENAMDECVKFSDENTRSVEKIAKAMAELDELEVMMVTPTEIAAASLFFASMFHGTTPSIWEFADVCEMAERDLKAGLEAVGSLPRIQREFAEVEDMIRGAVANLNYPPSVYAAALTLWRTVADRIEKKAKNRQSIVVAILYLVMLEKEEVDAIGRLGEIVEAVGFVTEGTAKAILHVIDDLDSVYGYRQFPEFEALRVPYVVGIYR